MKFQVCTQCGMIATADVSTCRTEQGEPVGCGGKNFRPLNEKEKESVVRRTFLSPCGVSGYVMVASAAAGFSIKSSNKKAYPSQF